MGQDGRIDLAAWDRLLDWHRASGSDGVVVGGTTGESSSLTEDEFQELLALAVEKLSGKVAVLAGTGSPDTRGAIARTRLAADLGADGALIVTPSYNKPPQRGLVAHFRAVADAVDLPQILYNVPSRTGVDLLPQAVATLAEHERIVAIKEAVPEEARMVQLLETVAGRIDILSGDDGSACRSMALGAQGVISVAANVVPVRFKALCEAAMSQEEGDRAESLRAELEPLFRFLGIESNPIPVKWLLAQLGRIDTGIRLPLVPLAGNHQVSGERLVHELNLEKG